MHETHGLEVLKDEYVIIDKQTGQDVFNQYDSYEYNLKSFNAYNELIKVSVYALVVAALGIIALSKKFNSIVFAAIVLFVPIYASISMYISGARNNFV